MKHLLIFAILLLCFSCNKLQYPSLMSNSDANRALAVYLTSYDYPTIFNVDEKTIHLQPQRMCYKEQIHGREIVDSIIVLLYTLQTVKNHNPVSKYSSGGYIWSSVEIVTAKKRYYVGFYKNGVISYNQKYYAYNEDLAMCVLSRLHTLLLESVPANSVYYPVCSRILAQRKKP